MPIQNGLTEKMKSFCREYFTNGGNGTLAYLTAYNSNNPEVAANESSLLLKRKDIQEYLVSMNKPLEHKAISEREKKRNIIWERIEYCISQGNDNAVARYMDILNKMDSEYLNINVNRDETTTPLDGLDAETLKALAVGKPDEPATT